MNRSESLELSELQRAQDLESPASTTDENFDRPSTSGTQTHPNVTAHEEALESHPLLDGSEQHEGSQPGPSTRRTLRIDDKDRPQQKRRSLSMLVHSGSVHTIKVSPKKKRAPRGGRSMAAVLPAPPIPRNDRPPGLDYNLFTTKQTICQGLLLAALLMCNVSQLKTLVLTGHYYQFYRFVTTFVIFSIVLEIVLGVLLLLLGKDDLTDVYEQRRLDKLNNAAVFLAFMIIIVNVFVAAFGLIAD